MPIMSQAESMTAISAKQPDDAGLLSADCGLRF
jgi:hypothetical protein